MGIFVYNRFQTLKRTHDHPNQLPPSPRPLLFYLLWVVHVASQRPFVLHLFCGGLPPPNPRLNAARSGIASSSGKFFLQSFLKCEKIRVSDRNKTGFCRTFKIWGEFFEKSRNPENPSFGKKSEFRTEKIRVSDRIIRVLEKIQSLGASLRKNPRIPKIRVSDRKIRV